MGDYYDRQPTVKPTVAIEVVGTVSLSVVYKNRVGLVTAKIAPHTQW
jgi:hypothetical protein